MKSVVYIAFIFFLIPSLFCQKIKSGPMLGYNATREVGIWIESNQASKVKLKYWPVLNPKKVNFSLEVMASHENGYTAKLIAERLEPNTKYIYEIYIDGKREKPKYSQSFTTQQLWKWRNDAPDFKFLAGSCFYINEEAYDRPGKPYGGEYQILSHMTKENPHFMMWLGDNTYLREADWDSRSGVYARYSHTRNLAELQEFLVKTHHYAVWDDHDYGPNDNEWTYYGKEWTQSAFNNYWMNPTTNTAGNSGITSMFTWSDSDFFLLDNRTNRDVRDKNGKILGEHQFNWLIDALRFSEAKFKFICIGGQFLNTVAKYENHAVFAEERQAIIDAINKYKIKNVIFLTGDRHHSEVSKLITQDGIAIYDITSSSITSGAGPHEEDNKNRVEGSMIGQRNFAVINVTGNKEGRKLNLEYKDSNGKSLFTFSIVPEK